VNLLSSLVKIGVKYGGLRLAEKMARNYPRILMYHRFDEHGKGKGVSADQFEHQISELSANFECITISEIAARIKSGQRIARGKPVACVTVDDGYADFYEIAFPILKRYQVPASFYVTTGFVDGDCWFWYDRLEWIVSHSVDNKVTSDGRIYSSAEWNGDKAKVWGLLVSDYLKKDGSDIENLLQDLSSQVGVQVPQTAPEHYKAVTWDQLREMREAGIEIGGHTVNHYSLGRLDAQDVMDELKTCRNRLADELGEAPKAFCYPNGQPADIPADYAKVLREAGFESSVVAYYDKQGMADPYALRRHGIGESWYEFQKTIRGVDRLGAVLLGRNNVFDWGET
jgi:peptidoglycan/xylan/chitin deacetylase (PgdA/CDA1 family)